jgi:hypothetical protein
MSEESSGGGLKNAIIGLVTIIVTAIAGVIGKQLTLTLKITTQSRVVQVAAQQHQHQLQHQRRRTIGPKKNQSGN